MSYTAIVLKLKNVREHPNADRLKLATCLGSQVVVGLDSADDDLGVYFPSDGQLSHEFCHQNNLYRDNTLNKDTSKNGMFDANRRIRAQTFRGEKSDGFFVPLAYFNFLGKVDLIENLEFNTLKGVEICKKYMTPETLKSIKMRNNNLIKSKTPITNMFYEHLSTKYIERNLDSIQHNQEIIITEKFHGTSFRVGYVKVRKELNIFQRFLTRLNLADIKKYDWKYLNGSRRVILDANKSKNSYHSHDIREYAFNKIKGNLKKGETIYGEIVGYENGISGVKPIMSTVGTDKLPEIKKRYGKTITFSYGLPKGECEIYVYRMTFTNEDGYSVDYEWDKVVERCNEIGIKYAPELDRFYIDKNANLDVVREELLKKVEKLSEGDSTLTSEHLKEGVCVRINNNNFDTYKYKTFEFKVLEGIIKDSGIVDEEELQSY